MSTPGSKLTVGTDYYVEGGRWVFTAAFHLRRGHCCYSGCRHCPYGNSPADRANPADDDTPRPNEEGPCLPS
ncbi:MAG: hypothetical protein K2P78_00330 [Gemmataceae bacterium]|nr:hypothetical protein [Gemmataceae bacterium]